MRETRKEEQTTDLTGVEIVLASIGVIEFLLR